MEFQKISNFLNTMPNDKDLPRFVNKKWIEVYDQSEKMYSSNKGIRIKTSMLRSDLCDFSNAYIAVEGTITFEGDNNANKRNKNLAFKDNAPFINCISKINGVKIDNAENLDVVMLIYNLFQQTAYGIIIDMNQEKKLIEVYDQSEKIYSSNKEIRIKTSMLRSDLCNFSNAYIAVEGTTTLEGDNNAIKRNKNLAFKNNAPFINCISKINGVKIDNAEDLDVVMPMYNLLEYSKNYRKTTGSLWNYYRDEPSNPLSSNSESFKYKTSVVGKTPEENDSFLNAKVVIL